MYHLIVDLSECGGHLVGERAGDDHDVRLARGRTEDDADAILVVAGSSLIENKKFSKTKNFQITKQTNKKKGDRHTMCIISTAQQARPKVMGQNDERRAQLTMVSRVVVRNSFFFFFERPLLSR